MRIRFSLAAGAVAAAGALAVLGQAPVTAAAMPGHWHCPRGAVTAYVASGASYTVTPIRAADGTAGKPIKVGLFPDAIAITPDGKTAYVATTAPAR